MKDLIAILGLALIIAVYAMFPAYVIMDIANLANVSFLEDLRFYQAYGLYMIMRIAVTQKTVKDRDTDLELTFDKILSNLLINASAMLITWGLVRIVFFLFFNI
jgi:hypothetical protein